VTATDRANVVVVLSDEQRWDTLGCYGQPLPISPDLDRMAAEGVRFAHAFTPQPVCGPARACIQTGRYATETGCFRNNISLPRTERTLADYLGEAGYETAYIGKWHLATDGNDEDCYRARAIPPERRGGYRDYWLAADVASYCSHSQAGWLFDADGGRVCFEGYRADAYTDFAIDCLRRRDAGRPLLLFLSLVEPHPQPYHKLYEGPPPTRERFLYRDITYEGPDGSAERFADAPVPGDLREGEGFWREYLADYLGACESVDANVGRLLATLDELGMANDTLVLFTSDHGEHFYTRHPRTGRRRRHRSFRQPRRPRSDGAGRGGARAAATDARPPAPADRRRRRARAAGRGLRPDQRPADRPGLANEALEVRRRRTRRGPLARPR